jgi:predicted DNA-binding transcriptional regulator AlpA
MAEKTLGMKQIAHGLGCSDKTVRRKFEKGELPGAIKTGKGAAIKMSAADFGELKKRMQPANVGFREIMIPCLALRRETVAASLGISPSTFDTWVGEGLMPKGKKIRGVVLWDYTEIKAAWYRLSEAAGDPSVDDEPIWQADGEDAA